MKQMLHGSADMTMEQLEWVLFLPSVPSAPSSLRVLVWRRLRAAGALGVQTGVWALPRTPQHERFLQDLLRGMEVQGGSGAVFVATALAPTMSERMIERSRADRDQEYAEFCERCQQLRNELDKETRQEKFTFAELEENEQDLRKLVGWLRKITTRDFFGGQRAQEAREALDACAAALRTFTQAVYAREGLTPLTPHADRVGIPLPTPDAAEIPHDDASGAENGRGGHADIQDVQ